jgi:hypothetical protein
LSPLFCFSLFCAHCLGFRGLCHFVISLAVLLVYALLYYIYVLVVSYKRTRVAALRRLPATSKLSLRLAAMAHSQPTLPRSTSSSTRAPTTQSPSLPVPFSLTHTTCIYTLWILFAPCRRPVPPSSSWVAEEEQPELDLLLEARVSPRDVGH